MQTTNGRWIISRLLLAVILLLTSLSPKKTAAAPRQQTTHKVYVTDVRGTSFVVSWTTDSLSDGYVDWDVDTGMRPPPTQVDSDPVGSTTTHYVIVNNLMPATNYYFQIRSGATTDDNGGAYYIVTTGPDIISVPENKFLWGNVFESDGTTPIPNAIVYIQLQDNNGSGSPGDSQWVTARADGNGGWFFSDLSNIRVADASGFYTYTDGADNLRLVAQGGSVGTFGENGAEQIIPVPLLFDGVQNQFDMSVGSTPTSLNINSFTANTPRTILDWSPLLIAIFCLAGISALRALGIHSKRNEC